MVTTSPECDWCWGSEGEMNEGEWRSRFVTLTCRKTCEVPWASESPKGSKGRRCPGVTGLRGTIQGRTGNTRGKEPLAWPVDLELALNTHRWHVI